MRRRCLLGVGCLGFAAAAWVVQAAPQPAPQPAIDLMARALQPGELVVLTISGAAPAGALHVRAFDQDWSGFKGDDGHWRALVGIDLDVKPGEYAVSARLDGPAGVERATRRIAVASKTFRTRTLTVDEAFVNPPESARARIAEEAAELARLWQSSSGPPLWSGAMAPPVPHAANSAFGSRSVFNGEPRNPHTGADFASPAGTAVRAPAGGRVRLARDLYYSGGTVVIDHGAGLVSLFAHLSAIDAIVGAAVARGDVIGKVGATGRVTGPHLHWAMRASGARVDPLSVLYALGDRGSR